MSTGAKWNSYPKPWPHFLTSRPLLLSQARVKCLLKVSKSTSVPGAGELPKVARRTVEGLPWWSRCSEPTCQRRGHGFDLCSGKITHAARQLNLGTTATEPTLQSPCSATREAATMRTYTLQLESSPCSLQLEKATCSSEDPAQPKINKYFFFKKKKEWQWRCDRQNNDLPRLLKSYRTESVNLCYITQRN